MSAVIALSRDERMLVGRRRKIIRRRKTLADMNKGGFLRTAETEGRVSKLEKLVAALIEHLDLEIDDDGVIHDKALVHVPGVRPPDGSGVDGGGMGLPAAELREVRRAGDEPRVSTASDRRKRSR